MDEGRGPLGLADSGSYPKPGRQISDPWAARRQTRPISELPTQYMPAPPRRRAPIAPIPRPNRRVSGWERVAARFQRRPRAFIISLALLLALALPVIATLAAGLYDYYSLKSLGQDAMARISAAKTDLLGQSASSGSSSGAGGAPGGSGSSSLGPNTLDQIAALLATPGPAVTNPAYTYLAQRQGGTNYALQVTVIPAKGVTAEGAKPATWKTTLGANTYFTLGGAPKPSAKTSSPAPTTTPGAGVNRTGAVGKLPDPARIASARRNLVAARSDFATLDARLAHPDWALSLAAVLPIGATDLASVRALAQVGVDATDAGLALLDAATPTLLRLHAAPSVLSSSQPLITLKDIAALRRGLTIASGKVDDIAARLKTVNIDALPLSASQKALLTQLIPLLPQVKTLADQAAPLLSVFGWIIGADATRHYLVQTLDRGELRATGGFTGQYSVLTLNGGKLGPLSLQDVNCLDYLTGCLSNGWIFGRRPPAPYDSWWPFANWGLRDSNLSADFPTNARLVMSVYQSESGQRVDGLIDISPLAIEDVLRVTGPITVDLYHETITADNLETRLHYYQQDPAAIALEKKLSGGGRKSFTQLVGQLLQARLKSLPLSAMLPLAVQMVGDLRNKNLQVYFSDPAAEKLLTTYALDGAVNTRPGVDGYLLVQSNVSVSKASSFVNVTQRDAVTLDARGGATHSLTLTFHGAYTYNQVYGYLTYRDYLRVYVPPRAQLLGGDGFDSGTPMCWPASAGKAPKAGPPLTPGGPPTDYTTLSTCGANPYPGGEMVCPSGDYAPGKRAPDVFGSTGRNQWPVDAPGGPTNTTSDLAGRAMFGGYIFVPDGCTATVTLSWYTPGVAPSA